MKAEEEAKTNAEEGGRTLNEGRKGDQDQCRRRQTSGYGLVRGAHMPRGREGTGGMRVRGRASNHGGNDGGTRKGTRIEVQRDIGVDTKRSSQSPKCKHDTEG